MNKSAKRIAVIGTGIMGNGIATNFLKKGYGVIVWNRNKNRLGDLLAHGAIEANSPKDAASKADILFEVTANDESSRSVWLSKNGILAGSKPETILITNATLSIPWVDELAKTCANQKRTFFDMPMTGGRIGAEMGKLILLVGGNPKKLKEIEKDLEAISEQVLYFGKSGTGMRFKLLLNMVQAIHLVGFGEVLKLAKQAGLDVKKVGDALANRPGGTTTNLAWRDYQTEPNPINFSIQWITKDLKYAKQLADKLNTPLLDNVLMKYDKAMKNKLGKKDWTEINKL